MATGVVFGDCMDNCILLFIKRHQKCWQSGLFHCTLPICDVDGTSGKASLGAYFTQPKLDPNRFQCSLQIRGLTLPGAGTGVQFYVQPNWSSLLNAKVWGDAASQIFYSYGLASNSLVSFASYCQVSMRPFFIALNITASIIIINNRKCDINFTFSSVFLPHRSLTRAHRTQPRPPQFKNNCHFDTVIVSLTNAFTAIFAGFAVFSVMGFMAQNLDVDVADVVQSGPGLAFIAYPEAVLMMPLPHLWAVSFFFMMFILGMGSQFGGIEALCTAIIDQWPHLRDQHWKVYILQYLPVLLLLLYYIQFILTMAIVLTVVQREEKKCTPKVITSIWC